jgi:hypothetical protein
MRQILSCSVGKNWNDHAQRIVEEKLPKEARTYRSVGGEIQDGRQSGGKTGND